MTQFFEGIIFISLFLPILDGIVSLFNQFIEFLCLKIAAKSYAIKKMIESEDQEQNETQAIGFHISNESEENDDEGEDI